MLYAQNPTQIPEVLQALQTYMDAQGDNQTGSWYALIDSAFDYNAQAEAGSPWPSVYAHGHACYFSGRVYSLTEAGPVLLPLPTMSGTTGDMGQAQLAELLQHCCGKPMLSFVCTEDANALLASWLDLHMAKTKEVGELLLRFADTRSQAVLPQILQAEQWAALTQSMHHWLTIDRQGKLLPLALATPDAPKASIPLYLSDAQLDAFVTAAEPDAMLEWMTATMADSIPRDMSPYRLYQGVCETLELAAQYHIDDQQDKLSLLLAAFVSIGGSNYSEALRPHLEAKAWTPGELGNFLSVQRHLFLK